jgi:ferredoxin-nitrite reductase
MATITRPSLVVVGTGLAGSKVVEEVLQRDRDRFQIRMFGAHPEGTSNRLFLTNLFGGLHQPSDLWLNPMQWYDSNGVCVHAGIRAESFDRQSRVVVGGNGRVIEPYDYLVLATGARPHAPVHEGVDRPGVFYLRSLAECTALGAAAVECDRAVVLGGSLLGLEAARGLLELGLQVVVVDEHPAASALSIAPAALAAGRRRLEDMGCRFLARRDPAAVFGDGRVEGIRWDDGDILETDMVVISCGQTANTEEARASGLAIENAILVDEQMRTNDPQVFALGQCAQPPRSHHGIVDAIFEQARILADVLTAGRSSKPTFGEKNKIEILKQKKDGLSSLPDILRLAATNNWGDVSEDDKQRFKWYGLFFRKQTPGNFMLRVRMEAGRTNSAQFRVMAVLSDEFGKGFCDLTTRQQVQLRWFTLGDVPEIWRRLESVGLHSKQTGMDNVRGVCGCPVAGLTPHELFDASPVVQAYTRAIVDNAEFTNLPRKFNVTISACLENCCHAETQDLALVPAYRELDGQQVNGFNVLVGGKQGSGGFRPATSLDVFVPPATAVDLALEVTRIYRDFGSRSSRTRSRFAFLIEDRGIHWVRGELERRLGTSLHTAGVDLRKAHHVDHLGIQPQRKSVRAPDVEHFAVGLLVPVGRITTAQMRACADLADRYGDGELRISVGQNIIIANVPLDRLGALTDEPLLQELPFDPGPILRGLVACTGTDYCHMALIETKGWAVNVARELEKRTAGRKIKPLTMHWSGCSAGCGLHQAATIGLQGCRSRVDGQVVDAAHVCVGGKTGPKPVIAADLLYDVPCDQLAAALEPLLSYLPR